MSIPEWMFPPTVRCPDCGWECNDEDGIGFQHCDNRGHCKHPSMSGEPLTCDLCHEADS